MLLEINNLNINCSDKTVLRNINLNLDAGEILAIVGESGSGKSTLLKAIIGILPTGWRCMTGEVLFAGSDLLKMDNKKLRAIRGAQLGMVFQNSAAALCPLRSIGAQLEESLRAHGWQNKQEIYTAAMERFRTLELSEPERIWRSYPFELSGGMSQRVAIAMAALLKPGVLLADEPTSALDIISQARIMRELGNLQAELNMAIIFVTHNIGLSAKFADRIAVMQQGQIVECDTAAQIVNRPQAEYTRALINAVPKIIRS